jgi:hypothetical protein
LQAETERLSKRILQLKTHRSDYFSKVIGLNLSGEWRQDRQDEKDSLNHSAVEPKINPN